MGVGGVPRSDSAPAFVACCARSGSTLLRFLIDAHPDMACPGETDLAVVASGYARIASDLTAAGDPLQVRADTRAMAEGLMARYLEHSGKSRWCDKSLSNVFHLEFLAELWPEARFVLLHRHCMDFVQNGLEVSPWGLSEYGFAQVAEKSPTDSVVALAAYWLDRTARLLAFEERFPERCLRVRYEDVVTDTERSADRLQEFLGLEPMNDLTERAFTAEHSTFGAADHEIWFSSGIAPGTIGRGASVPPGHVEGPLRSGVNRLLDQLDYVSVDDDWGSGANGSAPVAVGELDSTGRLAEFRVVDRHDLLATGVIDLVNGLWSSGAMSEAATRAGLVVAVEQQGFDAFAAGTMNLGSALRDRSVRFYGRLPHALRDEREVFLAIQRSVAANVTEIRGLADAAVRSVPTTGVTIRR